MLYFYFFPNFFNPLEKYASSQAVKTSKYSFHKAYFLLTEATNDIFIIERDFFKILASLAEWKYVG